MSFELALRFPGQQATSASGLFYNYQREYDPAVRRYSQSDPIGLEGRVNTYAYVGSMPIALNDPHGLQATFADCVSERRWDWGKLGASGPESTSTTCEVASGAQMASAAANSAVACHDVAACCGFPGRAGDAARGKRTPIRSSSSVVEFGRKTFGARGRGDDCMGGVLGYRLHGLLWLQRRRWIEANGNEGKPERKGGAVANWLP
ncbi:RHS repeat-associated core domain-containing protein [Stenotrophomonas maltophilia]|nr:RHS repeat-associated core domain-containing protein [Stenotrophomonas maltophilia]